MLIPTLRFGTSFWMSVPVVIVLARSSLPLIAVTVSGTLCNFSEDRRATTTISSSEEGVVLGAGAGFASDACGWPAGDAGSAAFCAWAIAPHSDTPHKKTPGRSVLRTNPFGILPLHLIANPFLDGTTTK
jgi:hypothetical protein